MKPKIILPALTIVLFATGGITLITLTDLLTQERRTVEKQAALARQLQAVAPTILNSSNQQISYAPEVPVAGIHQIYPLTHNAMPTGGHVLEIVAPEGYNGDIHLLVGIDSRQRISGVRVLNHRETPGLGDRIEINKSDWITRFDGLSATAEQRQWQLRKYGGDIDNLTGATITAKAVLNAVHNSVIHWSKHSETLSAQPK